MQKLELAFWRIVPLMLSVYVYYTAWTFMSSGAFKEALLAVQFGGGSVLLLVMGHWLVVYVNFKRIQKLWTPEISRVSKIDKMRFETDTGRIYEDISFIVNFGRKLFVGAEVLFMVHPQDSTKYKFLKIIKEGAIAPPKED